MSFHLCQIPVIRIQSTFKVIDKAWKEKRQVEVDRIQSGSLNPQMQMNPARSVFVGPNRCKLQDMLANLRDAEDLSSIQPPVAPPVRPSLPRLNEHPLGRTDEGISAAVTNTSR